MKNIIKTDDYLLVISDEEIKEEDNGVGFATGIHGKGRGYFIFKQDGTSIGKLNSICVGSKKIIAHLPLNNSRILEGVDLLPPLEDDVEKLALINAQTPIKEHREQDISTEIWISGARQLGFKEGYNKAKEKYKYTEEDLRKVLTDKSLYELSVDEIIQSLQQPKYTIGFECEMVTRVFDVYPQTINHIPKTTTNSQGQTVLEGKYIYE